MKKEIIRTLAISLAFFITCIIYMYSFENFLKTVDTNEDLQEKTFSLQTFYDELKKENIAFPKIIVAQAILESDSFKYEKAIKRNNFVGMHVPAQRYFFGNNHFEYGSYATYDSWMLGVKDIKSWQMQNTALIRTKEAYYDILQKIFAKDPKYKIKIKAIVDSLEEILI